MSIRRARKFISRYRLDFLAGELFLFAMVQAAGLLIGLRLMGRMRGVPTADILGAGSPLASFVFLGGFVIASGLYLLFVKKVRKKVPFRVFFSFLVFYGIYLALGAFLPEEASFVVALAVVFLRYQARNVLMHDISLMLAVIGLSSVLGIGVAPWHIAGLLAVLSIYDYIAVYKTGHMVEMFHGLMEKGVVMALVVPAKPGNLLCDISLAIPGDEFAFLGSGDLAFPMIFAVSVLPYGLAASVLTVAGAALGVVGLHLFLAMRKDRRPAPALPPIAGGAILGFLLSFLV